MTSETKRDGRAIEQLGYYSPITKQSYFKLEKILYWLKVGAQPTETVANLLKKANIIEVNQKLLDKILSNNFYMN